MNYIFFPLIQLISSPLKQHICHIPLAPLTPFSTFYFHRNSPTASRGSLLFWRMTTCSARWRWEPRTASSRSTAGIWLSGPSVTPQNSLSSSSASSRTRESSSLWMPATRSTCGISPPAGSSPHPPQ